MKVLVWFLLGVLVFWALKSQARRHQQKRQFPGSSNTPPKSAKPVEKMVACSYCQVYLPTSEAIHSAGGSSKHYFCSEEHARLYSNADKNSAQQ